MTIRHTRAATMDAVLQVPLWLMLAAAPASAQSIPASATSATEPAGSCAALTRGGPSLPCSFDFTRFPESDPRLARLATPSRATMLNGVVLPARNPRELAAAVARVKPGDQIVLADGVWTDAKISLALKGSWDHPVLIRPQSPGGVVFNGLSTLIVSGENVILSGLAFHGGTAKDRSIVVRLGAGVQRPCNFCVMDHFVIDDVNPPAAKRNTWTSMYVSVQGRRITVANSQFLNKKDLGTVLHAEHPAANQCTADLKRTGQCIQALTICGNVFAHVSEGERRTSIAHNHKVKLVEIGSGYTARESSFSIIENNRFEAADGGTNTVVIKTSDVIVRGNLFLNNLGVLNLRSSNRTLVENNKFDGSKQPGMGGVLIQGAGHWIVGNKFLHLASPLNLYHWPIAISAGAYEQLEDGQKDYARVRDVVIAHNVFDDVVPHPIAVGVYVNEQRDRRLPPENVFVNDNTFRFAGGERNGSPNDILNLQMRLGRDDAVQVTGNALSP